MIPVLTKLEIFDFVTQQMEYWQFKHILCRLGRARDTRQVRRTLSDRITVGDTSRQQAARRTYIVS